MMRLRLDLLSHHLPLINCIIRIGRFRQKISLAASKLSEFRLGEADSESVVIKYSDNEGEGGSSQLSDNYQQCHTYRQQVHGRISSLIQDYYVLFASQTSTNQWKSPLIHGKVTKENTRFPWTFTSDTHQLTISFHLLDGGV
jgi:hypothetical protein